MKVLSWNEVGDLSVSQISMLAAWELNAGVNGAHELLTHDMAPMAWWLRWLDRYDGYDGSRGSDGSDAAMEWWCREVKE